MKLLAFILNIPWTLLGFVAAMFSLPMKVEVKKEFISLIIKVRSFWWHHLFTGKKRARGMAIGHVVLLAPSADELDLKHELIHVEQMIREPFIHPFLTAIENLRFGYRGNKYEREAYERSGSRYFEDGNITPF